MAMNIEYCLLAPTGSAVLAGPVGNWWLEWCDHGLQAASPTNARPNDRPLPGWLQSAWECFWIGHSFDLTLCTSRPLSPFFTRVYNALINLMPDQGDMVTPAQLAETCGSAGSVASLVRALRENPWPLFLPAHRVVTGPSSDLSVRLERLSVQLRAYEQSMRDLGLSVCDLGSQVADRFGTACNWIRQVVAPDGKGVHPEN